MPGGLQQKQSQPTWGNVGSNYASSARSVPYLSLLHVLLAITEAKLRICGVSKGLFPGLSTADLAPMIPKH